MADAFAEWAAVVGADGVITDAAELARRGRTTLVSAPLPAGVVVPGSREQVAEVVRIAARHGMALYPVSTGRNWGWGDACPVGEGQVVLDLSRLQGIEVDEALGVAEVEAGVTQEGLAERLLSTAWIADCTTAGPWAGVVGNLMERGLGQSPLADRWAHVLGVEAVLADGSVVRTGFGEARAGHSMRWGAGPVLDGLFTQSNLGVVTRATVLLMPRPEVVQGLVQTVPEERLGAWFDALRAVRLAGVPLGAPHVFPMPDGRWLVVSGVSGVRELVEWGGARIDGELGRYGPVARFTAEAFDHVAVLSSVDLPDEPILREFLDAAATFTGGWPMQLSPLFVARYVGASEVRDTVDPLDAGYGLEFVWLAGTSRGADVEELVHVVRRTLLAHGRPFTVTLSCPTARAVMAVTRVAFAKGDGDDEAAAVRCRDEMYEAGRAAGFAPGRGSVATMGHLDADGSVHWDVVRRLKALLDPDGVIAPGRYDR